MRYVRFILGLTLLVTGCSAPRTYRSESVGTQEADPLARDRLEKDSFLRSSAESPLTAGDRAAFKGLSYFEVNPSLRFRLHLNRYPSPERLRIGTNTGEVRPAIRYGYFEFVVAGQTYRLQAYRMEEEETGGPRLFIPFRDLTSGVESYGAGRYLELKENTTGTYELDFNRAFNPYCAYNERFSCPVPPPENTLPVAIRAGEKKYPLAKEHVAG